MGKMTATSTITKSGLCPKCGSSVEFEQCELLPKIVPLCDLCEFKQQASWQIGEQRARWRRLYVARLPKGYLSSSPDRIASVFARAMTWKPSTNHGGLGLIGGSGAGKSSAIACLLFTLEMPFVWWSGTEARDAAIEAATSDKDRDGANRRWEHAMRVPLLVLDDISQGKMTEAWSSKLFDLLETRLGSGLPTLWTSQVSLPDLRAKIVRQNGGDHPQADAISRRLAQHSLTLRAL